MSNDIYQPTTRKLLNLRDDLKDALHNVGAVFQRTVDHNNPTEHAEAERVYQHLARVLGDLEEIAMRMKLDDEHSIGKK